MPHNCLNQSGYLHLLLLLAGMGILIIFLVLTLAPFKNQFSSLFPKQFSFAAETLTVDNLVLEPTFNSIDIELPFNDGSSETLVDAKLEFKKSSDTSWREGLPLWPTRPANTAAPAFQPTKPTAFGSVLLTEPGTSYDIRVTAKGSNGTSIIKIGTVITKAENISQAASLPATHYVSPTGDDGRTEAAARNKATPWKTLRRAIQAAPAGSIIETAPGYYVEPGSASGPITKTLTFKAEFPALDDNRQIINQGKHSIIQDGNQTGSGTGTVQTPFTSGPPGSGAPYENVWTQDTGLSAAAGKPIWKWAGSNHALGFSTAYQMGFHKSREDLPIRIMHWSRISNDTGTGAQQTNTPLSWATTLGTNLTYRYGFWQDSVAPYDIYMAPPPNMISTTGEPTQNPNQTWITVGGNFGPVIRAANVRITGFDIRALDQCLSVGNTSADSSSFDNTIIDHNIFSLCHTGLFFLSPSSPSNGIGLAGSGAVVEHNLFYDRTLWTDDHASDPGSPWVFTKEKITRANGTLSAANRYGSFNESAAVNFKNEAAKNTVIRRNTFDGPQNGVTSNGGVAYAPRDASRGTDIYENECVRIVDDCIEPEAAAVNWRIWNNKIHKTTVVLSGSPLHWGPVFFFRNQAYNIGASGGGIECCNPRKRVGTSALMKSGALNPLNGHVRSIIYWLHNTYWTNIDGSGPPNNADIGAFGIDATINGQGNYNIVQYVRNNIVRNTAYTSRVGQFDTNTNWNEDYNVFVSRPTTDFSSNGTRSSGMRIEGGINGHQFYDSQNPMENQVVNIAGSGNATLYSLAQYRSDLISVAGRPAEYGNGLHTNKIGPGKSDVAFTGPANGSGSVSILDALLTNPQSGDLSIKPGLNPLIDAGVPIPNVSDCFNGSAPDLGAIESGGTQSCSIPPNSSKEGDLDGNDSVDIFDYTIFLTDFGKTQAGLPADIDKNGIVDIFDYTFLLTNFGK